MRLVVFFLCLLAVFKLSGQQPEEFTAYVNPFIGTGGDMTAGFGNMFPGATYPFGMIQLSPDNGGQGWQYSAGYRYADSLIAGFSHTHLSGTGVGDYCDISVMPTIKPVSQRYFEQSDSTVHEIISEKGLNPNSFIDRDGHAGPFDKHFLLEYSSGFSHKTEFASPGYYGVKLQDDNIDVELTTSEFVGMHHYHFNKLSDKQHLVVNLGFTNSDRTTDAVMTCQSSEMVTGYRFSSGKANVQRVYFAMQFSRKITEYKWFLTDSTFTGNNARGKRLAAAFSFDAKESKDLMIKVAISSVSVEGALANLKTADKFGWDFKGMHNTTRKKWNEELSKIRIATTDSTRRTVFYTSLYHSYLAPYRFSDTDGYYKNFNHKREKAEGYTHYTLLSLWDTFRAENPLLSLMQPKVEEDIIHSMISKFRQTGELPYWEISGNEGGSMIGYHAAVLMADALAKKIGKYDNEEIFKSLIAVSNTNRKGLDYYRKFHFVPTDLEKAGTVSKTLEYAYDDWCIAQIAKQLGKTNDCKKYLERSGWYKNLYDPSYHLMRGKNSDGSWFTPFDPRFAEYGNPHCVEGNTWQYSFFAPHDMAGLIKLMGGKKDFGMMLDSLFNQSSELLGDDVADVTGLIGQYSQGNEPDHNSAYLFDFIDQPHKSQYFTNKIIKTLYRNSPEGLCGNEDCGQMSAWYVFSSIGLYPVNPVDGKYWFGSPQFENVTINLPNGKTFTVVAKNVSAENIYIKLARLNGNTLNRLYITYDEIQKGGRLEFDMTNKTN